jgi:probable rRNA maturation factor
MPFTLRARDVDVSERVEVLADPPFDNESDLQLVRMAAETALEKEHRGGPDSVAVLLTGDDRIRELHREFMGDDSVTDVLSFNEQPGWKDGTPPAAVEDGFPILAVPRLGDIVISVQQVRRQAEEAGVLFERELAMLAAHGVLHLLGYDHAELEEERRMFGKTDAILAEIFRGSDPAR